MDDIRQKSVIQSESEFRKTKFQGVRYKGRGIAQGLGLLQVAASEKVFTGEKRERTIAAARCAMLRLLHFFFLYYRVWDVTIIKCNWINHNKLFAEEIDIRDRSSSIADANERANKLSQRMRDLYDFKTENEWPKRAGSSPHENSWISKSSSEEERNNYPPVRRNSQDLEFNDRFDGFKVRSVIRFSNTRC